MSKQTSFRKLLSSYIYLLLFAIVIMILITQIAAHSMTLEIEKIAKMNVAQMKSSFDSTIDTLQNTALALAYRSEVIDGLSIRDMRAGQATMQQESIRQTLSAVKINDPSIDDIYVLYPPAKTVISIDYAYNASLSDALCRKRFGSDFESVFRTLSGSFLHGPFLMKGEAEAEYQLVVAAPVLAPKSYDYQAVVLIVLEPERLHDLISNYEYPSGTFSILTKDVAISTDAEAPDRSELDLSNSSGVSVQQTGQGQQVVAVASSSVADFLYVAVVPYSDYMSGIRQFQVRTIIILIGCAVLGTILSLLLAKHNVLPIRRLIGVLNADGYVDQNEFVYLESALLGLMEKKRYGDEAQGKYEALMRDHLIGTVLNGEAYDEKSLLEANDKFGVGITGSRFRVAAIRVTDSSSFAVQNQADRNTLLRMTIDAIVKHSAPPRMTVVPSYIAERYIYILCLREPELDEYLPIDWINVQSLLEKEMGLKTTIAVSGDRDGLGGIALAYQEVAGLFEHAAMYGITGQVLRENAVEGGRREDAGGGFVQMERSIIALILSKNYVEVSNQLLAVLDAPSQGIESTEMLRHLLYTVVLTLEDARSAFPRGFFDSLNVRRRLLEATTITEVRSAVRGVFGDLDGYVRATDAKAEKMANRTLEYIEAHYSNPLLSRVFIAEQLDISISSLSHTFKECTGNTVMEHIQQMRVRAAKDLLENTDLNLQEICERVGFTNIWTFTRAFKSLEGISPGKYREASGK